MAPYDNHLLGVVEGGDGGSHSPLHVEGDPVIQPHMAGGEQVHIAGSKQHEVEGQHHAYPFAGEGFGLNLLVEIYFSSDYRLET